MTLGPDVAYIREQMAAQHAFNELRLLTGSAERALWVMRMTPEFGAPPAVDRGEWFGKDDA